MNEDKPSNRTARPRWGRRALLILVPLLLAGGWYGRSAFIGERDPTTNYQFTTVQRGDVEDVVTATGTLQPRDYVDVGAQVSGQLRKIHVEVGDTVEAGQLLAEIDPTVYRA
ncbi:MAG: biotin/lipoyl-binding protein, partial [Thauera sp.]|nr:biotin/lipoyl-binding protein [Thauera sp.]